MDLNFLSEQAKHMWNGSNFAYEQKNFLKWNGLTLIPAGNWILAGQMVIKKRGEEKILWLMRWGMSDLALFRSANHWLSDEQKGKLII
jgi:hypothetical protein